MATTTTTTTTTTEETSFGSGVREELSSSEERVLSTRYSHRKAASSSGAVRLELPSTHSQSSIIMDTSNNSSSHNSSSQMGKNNRKKKRSSSSRSINATTGAPFRMSRTVMLRALLIVSLLSAVVVCATLSYLVLDNTEQEVGRQTYQSIANSALVNAQSITRRKLQGSEVMATLMSQILPDAKDWPFVSLKGYMPVAQKVAQLAQSTTQALMVILDDPSVWDQTQFEEHTKQQYRAQGHPESAGYSDFGFGIWKPDPNNNSDGFPAQFPDGRLHETSVDTSWGGKHKIFVPLMLHNKPGASSLMYNLYSEENRGSHIDAMFECIERMTASNNETESDADAGAKPPIACPVVTDVLVLKIRPGPAALLFQPICPANDPSKFVGFATTSIHWQEVLEAVVPDYVDGLTCVISTATTAYTYEIRGGHPVLLGEGDLHDVRYTKDGQSVTLNDIETGTKTSAIYTLTVYPTDKILATFSTNSPLAVALGFFGVIAFCTFIFFMYDFFMRHEAQQRRAILEMKRRFVRFISHEIRTPLNTVCMGLELLESELRDADKNLREHDEHDKTQRIKQQDDTADDTLSGTTSHEDLDFWHHVTVDVKENAHIAVSILNDLLNYDKLETGTLKLETSIVCIWELVERTINQFRIQAVNRKIDLKLNILKPPSLTPAGQASDIECGGSGCQDTTINVIGDDVRLSQVLRNLFSNALKFTPADGTIQVTAEYDPEGLADAKPLMSKGEDVCNKYTRSGAIRITVQDSGVGLSAEQLQMLFSEGVQFDANRLQHGGGSGLGLNIAKGIVEQHSGTIHAESDGEGKGAAFIIELPLYDIPPKDMMKDSMTGADTTVSTGHPSAGSGTSATAAVPFASADFVSASKFKRVLVAEDTQSSRKMLIRLLERVGHVCVPACNGQEAVAAIANDMAIAAADIGHEPITTILMDFEMPILKGPDATKQIRAMGYKGTILGVTGNVLQEDIEFFIRHGADDVLPKPVSLERIEEYWDHQKQQRGESKSESECDRAMKIKRKKRQSFDRIEPARYKCNERAEQAPAEPPSDEFEV